MKKFRLENSIYEFCHFRDFLELYYKTRKTDEGFNFDKFEEETGLARANLWRIIEGKAQLNDRSKTFKLCEVFGFDKAERRFFETLVDFNQSQSAQEAMDRLETLLELLPVDYYQGLVAKYSLVPWWLSQTMLEVAQMKDFDGSFLNLAKRFHFDVTPAELKRSLEVLLQNGILKKVAKGKYEANTDLHLDMKVDGASQGQEEFAKKAVLALQCKQIEMIQSAADKLDYSKAYIINHTISLPNEKIPELEKLILNFRDEVQAFMTRYPSEETDQVVQLNTSLIPLMESIKKTQA